MDDLMERDTKLKHRPSTLRGDGRSSGRSVNGFLRRGHRAGHVGGGCPGAGRRPHDRQGHDDRDRSINNLIINALSNPTNVIQADGTTLTLEGGFITTNGTNATSLGNAAGTGRLFTTTGFFDVINNDGSVFTLSSILLGAQNQLSVSGGTTILTSTQNQITGGILINGGAALRVATEANLGPVSNPVILNGGNLEVSQSLTFDAKRTFTVQRLGGAIVPLAGATVSLLGNNQLVPTVGTFTKGGPGTLIIGGTNTFSRGVIVNQGVLELDNPGAFGGTAATAPKSAIQLNPGGTLRLKSDADVLNFNDPISVAGTSLIDFGRDTLTKGGNFLLGPVTFPEPGATAPTLILRNFSADKSVLHFTDVTLPQTGNFNVFTATTSVMIDGTATGAGGINKTGDGILYLQGSTSNSLGATSFMNAGTLVLSKDSGLVAISNDLQINAGLARLDATGQFGAFSDVVVNGGTLNFNSFNTAFGTLTNNGGVIRTGAALGFLPRAGRGRARPRHRRARRRPPAGPALPGAQPDGRHNHDRPGRADRRGLRARLGRHEHRQRDRQAHRRRGRDVHVGHECPEHHTARRRRHAGPHSTRRRCHRANAPGASLTSSGGGSLARSTWAPRPARSPWTAPPPTGSPSRPTS